MGTLAHLLTLSIGHLNALVQAAKTHNDDTTPDFTSAIVNNPDFAENALHLRRLHDAAMEFLATKPRNMDITILPLPPFFPSAKALEQRSADPEKALARWEEMQDVPCPDELRQMAGMLTISMETDHPAAIGARQALADIVMEMHNNYFRRQQAA